MKVVGGHGERDATVPAEAPVAGHRLVRRGGGEGVVEAWGPERAACTVEALSGVVELFADVDDPVCTETLPLSAPGAGGRDALVSLVEEVLFAVDALGVVPVRFHLVEAQDGTLVGDMDVVPTSQVDILGPVPEGISSEGLESDADERGWRCSVRLDL